MSVKRMCSQSTPSSIFLSEARHSPTTSRLCPQNKAAPKIIGSFNCNLVRTCLQLLWPNPCNYNAPFQWLDNYEMLRLLKCSPISPRLLPAHLFSLWHHTGGCPRFACMVCNPLGRTYVLESVALPALCRQFPVQPSHIFRSVCNGGKHGLLGFVDEEF